MTDWEQQYRIGDTPWDKGAPAPPLLEWIEKATRPLGGKILVPGCGLGHDVRALAAAFPQAEVLGLDLAPSAIAAAKEIPFAGKVEFVLGDLFTLPREMPGAFDAIFEHTCFCAIDPAKRADCAAAVGALLKPRGHVLALFYLNPHDPGEDRTGPPHASALEEIDALFSPAFRLLEDSVPTRAYPGREGRERLRLYEKRADFLSP